MGIALVVGAVLVGLYLVISVFPSGLGASKGAQQASNLGGEHDGSLTEATSHLTPAEMERFIVSISKAESGPDPFLSSGEQEWKRFLGELRERPPRLKGIIQMKDARVALIQDSRFREGDEVQGFRIIKIEDKRVLLAKGGKIHTVHLAE
jgi:hypothetical protein